MRVFSTRHFLVLCCALCVFSAAADELDERPPLPESEGLSFPDAPGSYVIYRDVTGKDERYVGLCYLGGNELAIRMYNQADGSEVVVVETLYTIPAENGRRELDPGSITIIRGDINGSAVRDLVPRTWQWIQSWLSSRPSAPDALEWTYEEESVYSFEYWIPLIQLRSDGSAYRLVTAGRIQSVTDASFFAFTGEGVAEGGPVYDLVYTPGAAEMTGKALPSRPLWFPDSHWVTASDGISRITRVTGQDAFAVEESVSSGDIGGLDSLTFMKLLVVHSGYELVADRVRVFREGDDVCALFCVHDRESATRTVQFKRLRQEAGRFRILSLGVAQSLFDRNPQYFSTVAGVQLFR